MSPQLRVLFYYLWIAPHALQVVLAAAMIRRRLQRKFLMFFLYTLFELCQFSFLIFLASSKSLLNPSYREAFAFGTAASVTLRFGIIYEIFNDLFSGYKAIKHVGERAFRWAAALLLLLGAGLASGTLTATVQTPLDALYVIDQTISIIQCGLLVCLFVLASFYGLSMKSVSFGIALGFGLLECNALAAAALRTHVGSKYFWDFFVMGIYHVCVLVWLFYVLIPEKPSSPPPDSQIPEHDLDAWNDELQRLIRQ